VLHHHVQEVERVTATAKTLVNEVWEVVSVEVWFITHDWLLDTS
jgi:hypothetical protein